MRRSRSSFAAGIALAAAVLLAAAGSASGPGASGPIGSGAEASVPPAAPSQGGGTRGCCVLQAPSASCAYTTRSYCERRAEETSSSFQFFPGVSCRDRPECRGD